MVRTLPRILLVEDDEGLVDLIEVAFRGEPYCLLIGRNGLEGVEMASSDHPDLILMDVVMPILNGYEAARRIRNNPETGSIPIYFLTAKSMEEDILSGRLAGGDRYLIKPFSPFTLLQLLGDHFRGRPLPVLPEAAL